MFLIVVCCLLGKSDGSVLASKVGPDKAEVEREARQIEQMTADNDIDGLIGMLANGTFPSKVRVATYLKDVGDRRALPELERANRELGGWDLKTPCDDRSGIFPVAIWKITTNDLSDSEKIDALLELLEGRGPIVPELKTYDTVTVNGVSREIPRVTAPNYFVGICAEEELEQFGVPTVTCSLRKSEHKGIAAYAVWREVRVRPTEAAISRCVRIVHEEGRTQQYGAIHCLERFDHPNAVLALDIIAGEGYSEAIRALNQFGSQPDVFERLCNHLLQNPYYVVRLFAVSAVRFTGNESLRTKSLNALVRALYDPSEQLRRSAAESLSNYIFPITKSQLMVIQEDLLLASEHPDAEVRSRIRTALERVGWLDLDMPEREAPDIRTDIEANAYSTGGGLERKKRMIALLEQQAREALEKGKNNRVNEIYRKLLILEPQNEAYRSHLPDVYSEKTALLSEAQVLRMADEFAGQKLAKYGTFDLKFYPDRSATFNPKTKNWFVHYMREPNRWPGDHFSVYVDDTTGSSSSADVDAQTLQVPYIGQLITNDPNAKPGSGADNPKPGAPLDPEKLGRLAWGPPATNGLRAACYFEPSKEVYTDGEVVKRRLVFHNSGKEPVLFTVGLGGNDDAWTVVNEQGQKVPLDHVIYFGGVRLMTFRLEPGHATEIACMSTGMGASTKAAYPADTAIQAKPGTTCRVRWMLGVAQTTRRENGKSVPVAGIWYGTLTTGEVGFCIVEKAAPSRAAEDEHLQNPALKRFYSEVQTLFRRHYPKATSHLLRDKIHFERDTRVFIVHEPLKTGEWQGPLEERGPKSGGILCDMTLQKGNY